METYRADWLVLVLNAILIALILTVPLLVVFFTIRVFHKVLYNDRRSFEDKLNSKLEDIAESLEGIQKRLENLSGRRD